MNDIKNCLFTKNRVSFLLCIWDWVFSNPKETQHIPRVHLFKITEIMEITIGP